MANQSFTPENEAYIAQLSQLAASRGMIDPELYRRYDVKRGLRDLNGKGVLAGLTEISEIRSSKNVNGESVPCEGELFYRGVEVRRLVDGFVKDGRFGFEETVYLLLFGALPTKEQLERFVTLLSELRTLPPSFVRDIILKATSRDMMNMLARSVLTLYTYDEQADSIALPNVLRQCLELISRFPLLAVYGYRAYAHYHSDKTLLIRPPEPSLGTAENILLTLRPSGQYTPLEARLLDLALVLHAEHGGGNNSSFTTHVVSSSGTDTYSVMAAALGSLKGPRHGGANIKVVQMFEDMKNTLTDWKDEGQITAYLEALLEKRAFDGAGLIYGMGHAVYSLSDPRAEVFKGFVESLAREKGRTEEYELYAAVERLAPRIIGEKRRIYKGVSANVDFYSGFVYSMLDLPAELYTPIFAIGRIAGWSAHRMEELMNAGKIIRPSYMAVLEEQPYKPLEER